MRIFMAAFDTFERYNASLSDDERQELRDLIAAYRTELREARSEDARLRIVHSYLEELRHLPRTHKK
jgi:hypothetical protein